MIPNLLRKERSLLLLTDTYTNHCICIPFIAALLDHISSCHCYPYIYTTAILSLYCLLSYIAVTHAVTLALVSSFILLCFVMSLSFLLQLNLFAPLAALLSCIQIALMQRTHPFFHIDKYNKNSKIFSSQSHLYCLRE
jgi:hypothetical protein